MRASSSSSSSSSSHYSSLDNQDNLNHYQLLNVSTHATQTEIRKSYLSLIKLNHPDKNSSLDFLIHQPTTQTQRIHQTKSNYQHQITQNLILAYKTLINPIERQRYDSIIFNQKDERPINSKQLIISNVLDLSEFTQIESSSSSSSSSDSEAEEEEEAEEIEKFVYECRCGGEFMITNLDMKLQIEIISCDGCSLNVKVEYQPCLSD